MELSSIPDAFQSALRLSVLSAVMLGEKSFRELKRITGATDGNLGAQIRKLEEQGYLVCEKTFSARKPLTTVSLTPFGREQFREYVELLERIIKEATK